MITVHDAAVLLGGTDAWVRSLCQRRIIGDSWCSSWNSKDGFATNPKRFTYVIVPGQLAEFMRISEEELMERLKDVEHK